MLTDIKETYQYLYNTIYLFKYKLRIPVQNNKMNNIDYAGRRCQRSLKITNMRTLKT